MIIRLIVCLLLFIFSPNACSGPGSKLATPFVEAAFPDTNVQYRQINMNGLNHVNNGPIGPTGGDETLVMKILPTSTSQTLGVTIINAVITNTIFWIETPANGKAVKLNMYMENVRMVDSFFKIHRLTPAASFESTLSNTYSIIIRSSTITQRSAYMDSAFKLASLYSTSACQPAVALFYFQTDEYEAGAYYIEVANTLLNFSVYNYSQALSRGFSKSGLNDNTPITYGTVDRASGQTPTTMSLAYYCNPLAVRGQIVLRNVQGVFRSLEPMANVGLYGFAYIQGDSPSSPANYPRITTGGVFQTENVRVSFSNGCDFVNPNRSSVGCNNFTAFNASSEIISHHTSFIFQSTNNSSNRNLSSSAESTFLIEAGGKLIVGPFTANCSPRGAFFGPTCSLVAVSGPTTEVRISNLEFSNAVAWPSWMCFLPHMTASSGAHIDMQGVNLTQGFSGLFLAKATTLTGATFQVCATTIGEKYYPYEESYDLMGPEVNITLCEGSPGRPEVLIPAADTTPTPEATSEASSGERKRFGFKFSCSFAMEVEELTLYKSLIISELAALAGVTEDKVDIVSIQAGSAVVEAHVYDATEEDAKKIIVAIRSGISPLATVLHAIADTLKITKLTSNVALQQTLAVLIVVCLVVSLLMVIIALVYFVRKDIKDSARAKKTLKKLGMTKDAIDEEAAWEDEDLDLENTFSTALQKDDQKRRLLLNNGNRPKFEHVGANQNVFSVVGGQLRINGTSVAPLTHLTKDKVGRDDDSSGSREVPALDLAMEALQPDPAVSISPNTTNLAQQAHHHRDSNSSFDEPAGVFGRSSFTTAPTSPTLRKGSVKGTKKISPSSSQSTSEAPTAVGASILGLQNQAESHFAASDKPIPCESPSNTSLPTIDCTTPDKKDNKPDPLSSTLFTDAMYNRVEVANAMWAEMSMPDMVGEKHTSNEGGLRAPPRAQFPLAHSPLVEGIQDFTAFAESSNKKIEGQEVTIFVASNNNSKTTYQSQFPPILPRMSAPRNGSSSTPSSGSLSYSSPSPRASSLSTSNPLKLKKKVTIQEVTPSPVENGSPSSPVAIPSVFATGSREEEGE